MAKQNDLIEMNGEIIEVLPNTTFRVKIENDHILIGYIGGKLKANHIRVMINDKVKVEISPYDLSKCRIIYRYR